MHIAEGILSHSSGGMMVLGVGVAVTAAGTAIGLRKMDYERVPQVALLSAAFFVISLIHVPCGPTAVHLVLSGLVGIVLGWAAFPALLVALGLQAVFFQLGGLTTLGLNTAIMALPAVGCYWLFHRLVCGRHDALAFTAAAIAGSLAVLSAAALAAVSLWLAGKEFQVASGLMLAVHLAVAAVEGFVTGSVVVFLRRVHPEMLESPLLVPVSAEAAHG